MATLKNSKFRFTGYQKFVVAILTLLQFTVMLNFMVISPLGVILIKDLNITTIQFSSAVSVYAVCAAVSGVLFTGFADRFDRKKLLLLVYTGFFIGTVLCAFAPDYIIFLIARSVTGFFGGIIGAICISVITDIFPYEARGTVSGYLASAQSGAMVFGIPVGLYLANDFGWHAPFFIISGVCLGSGLIALIGLKPMFGHKNLIQKDNPISKILQTMTNKRYLNGFISVMLVSLGAFMILPFASDFMVSNQGVSVDWLPLVYICGGAVSMVAAPLMGRLSDKIGKYTVFFLASLLAVGGIAWFTNSGLTTFWLVVIMNCLISVANSSRMGTIIAITTTVPEQKDRGSYNAMTSTMQQLAGAIASWMAGIIVVQDQLGVVKNFNIIGWIIIIATVVNIFQTLQLSRVIQRKSK